MKTVESIPDKLEPNESIVCTCEKCGKYRIVDLEKDALKPVIDLPGHKRYRCVCGEIFYISD